MAATTRPGRAAEAERHRRIVALSLLASVAVHAWLAEWPVPAPPERPSRSSPPVRRTLGDALRLVRIDAPAVPSAERAGPPVGATPDPTRAEAPTPARAAADEPGTRLPRPRRHTPAAARLRVRRSDPGLWRGAPAGGLGPAPARIGLAAAATRGAPAPTRLRDGWAFATWVRAGADGSRWGASPGVLHLGSFAVPVCGGDFDASSCGFGLPPSERDGYRRRLRAVHEIARQGAFAEIEARRRAIRRRLDALRDSLRARRGGG